MYMEAEAVSKDSEPLELLLRTNAQVLYIECVLYCRMCSLAMGCCVPTECIGQVPRPPISVSVCNRVYRPCSSSRASDAHPESSSANLNPHPKSSSSNLNAETLNATAAAEARPGRVCAPGRLQDCNRRGAARTRHQATALCASFLPLLVCVGACVAGLQPTCAEAA